MTCEKVQRIIKEHCAWIGSEHMPDDRIAALAGRDTVFRSCIISAYFRIENLAVPGIELFKPESCCNKD
jgi:hypothetical protein